MYTHTSKGVVTHNKRFTINMEYNKAFKPMRYEYKGTGSYMYTICR